LHSPFYEYAVVASKIREPEYNRNSAPTISRSVSFTFAARGRSGGLR
jgi:hypothetical protein